MKALEMTQVQDQSLQAQKGLSSELFHRFVSFIDAPSPRTAESYAKAVKRFYEWLYFKGIAEPNRGDLIAYRDELKEQYKATTVNAYMTPVRLFFRWTAQEGLYPNVADNLKGAKASKQNKRDYLTSTQIRKVLEGINRDAATGHRDYAMIALMTTCGLRDIEISRANAGDLQALGNATVLYVHGKGKEDKEDFVRVSEEVEEILRAYMKRQGIKDPSEPMFQSASNNSKGKRLTTRSISGIVKQAFINAGYDSERLTAHSLRHTAVTLSLLEGQTLQEAQQFARHASIETTQIYAHNLDKAANECSEAVTRAIFGA